ncbi:MAG: transposase [Eubacteriaceae bacterium]|nr:transposase [Eubacteriaceae bacterium]
MEGGLDPGEPRLCAIDGGKALAKAINDTFGDKAVVQGCQAHKKRNVLGHLPESGKSEVAKRLSLAYMEFEYNEALSCLENIAAYLDMRYPSAAETLAVARLEIPGLLRAAVCPANPIEPANSACAGVIRRVSNFNSGETALRQAAAGFMEAERGFRRIKGYKQIPSLIIALERETEKK